MYTKSSAFTLIELLVVIAIIGILSAVGTLSYTSYLGGTKQTAAESAMQQISLAQTEEYSNSGEYYIQIETDVCTPDRTFSDEIESKLFGGADVIADDIGYEMCIAPTGSSYVVIAKGGKNGNCTITMTANGVWTRESC